MKVVLTLDFKLDFLLADIAGARLHRLADEHFVIGARHVRD